MLLITRSKQREHVLPIIEIKSAHNVAPIIPPATRTSFHDLRTILLYPPNTATAQW